MKFTDAAPSIFKISKSEVVAEPRFSQKILRNSSDIKPKKSNTVAFNKTVIEEEAAEPPMEV